MGIVMCLKNSVVFAFAILLATIVILLSGCPLQPPTCGDNICEKGIEDNPSLATYCSQDCQMPTFNLTFIVQDTEGNPIAGALVEVNDDLGPTDQAKTDSEGIATFVLEPDNYTTNVSAEGYEQNKGEINLKEAKKIVVVLNKIQPTATFNLSIDSVSGTTGQTVDIPVYIEAVEADKQLSGLGIEIKENPLLDVISVSLSDAIGSYCNLESNPDREDIEVIIAGFCSGALPKNEKVQIGTLHATLGQQPGKNELEFSSIQIADNSAPPSEYSNSSQNGQVIVSGTEAKVKIGGDNLEITDTMGVVRSIPLVIALTAGTNQIMIDGKPYVIDVNNQVNKTRSWVNSMDASAVPNPWGNPPLGYEDVTYDDQEISRTNITFMVSPDWNTDRQGKVGYNLAAYNSNSKYWLLLSREGFDQKFLFGGTYFNDAFPTLPFYLPDLATFNFLVDRDIPTVPSEGDNQAFTARFLYYVDAYTPIQVFIDTSSNRLVNTTDGKQRLDIATAEVKYKSSNKSWSLNEYIDGGMTQGITEDGTVVSVSNGIATIAS